MARYLIDPEQSTVWIDARSNVHPIHSSADGLTGFVDFDGTPPAGQLSFPVSKLTSGNPLERRELQKRIDAKHHPTIDGILTSVDSRNEAGQLHVRGDLSFRGVTRSVGGDIVVSVVDDHTIRIEGRATFDIRDYGMEPPRVLVLRVEPEVDVRIELVATRET